MPEIWIADFSSPWWFVAVTILGACVGSFLNVVIYRLPLGLSVNEPKRSFCPHCQKLIAWYHNIPVISWIMLRGSCAQCSAKISCRYWLVELLTAALFAVCWHFHPITIAPLLFLWISLAVAIAFIDAEHQIIPIDLTTAGSIIAIVYSTWQTDLLDVFSPRLAPVAWWQGPIDATLGWIFGFFSLWAVVLLGKWAFGKKSVHFDQAVDWELREPVDEGDSLIFHCDGDDIPWHDLFYRPSDQLILTCTALVLDDQKIADGRLLIRAEEITLPDGQVIALEKIRSLHGKTTHAIIPREAMGMGDPHLLGMIGAFLGAPAVLFTIAISSFYAIAAAILGRIGFGKALPFGPFLLLAALTWILGGWRWVHLYLDWTFGMTQP